MAVKAVRTTELETPIAHPSGPREPPLVLRAMRGVLKDIFSGVYGPGDRIRENEVAERLDISRAPVREALRILEQDGMIELTPWQGARVIDPKPEEMADLFDMLGAVQGVVARLAVRHASAAQLKRYADDVRAIERCVQDGGGLAEVIELAYRAGAHLGNCCGSAQAASTFRRLGRPAFWLHRFLAPVQRRWLTQSVTRQRKLLEALQARSEVRAEKAARRLIWHTRNLVLSRAIAAREASRTSNVRLLRPTGAMK